MKKVTIGIAVLIVLGLSTASLANVEKHRHYCKVQTTQKRLNANVTEYSNTNQTDNLDKEPNALDNKQQFKAQADKQYQQEQDQANLDKEPNALENKQQFKAQADKQYQQEQNQAKRDVKRSGANY